MEINKQKTIKITFFILFILSLFLVNACNQKEKNVKVSKVDLTNAIYEEDLETLNQLLQKEEVKDYIDEEIIISAYETGNKNMVIQLLARSTIDPNTITVNTSNKYYHAKLKSAEIPLSFALFFDESTNLPESVKQWFFSKLRDYRSFKVHKMNINNSSEGYLVTVAYEAKDSKGKLVNRTLRFTLDKETYQIKEIDKSPLSILDSLKSQVWNINRQAVLRDS